MCFLFAIKQSRFHSTALLETGFNAFFDAALSNSLNSCNTDIEGDADVRIDPTPLCLCNISFQQNSSMSDRIGGSFPSAAKLFKRATFFWSERNDDMR